MRFVSRRIVAVAVAATASLALAATTSADGVSGGKTKLKPDQDTFEGFADMSISVDATGRAEWTDTGAKFPVIGGDFTPGRGGIIGHAGGLLFTRSTDGASAKFSKPAILVRGHRMHLFAQSDHEPVKLLKLDGEVAGTDTSVLIKNAEATLSRQGAQVLSQAFDFPFHKGIPFGTTTTKAQLGGQVEE